MFACERARENERKRKVVNSCCLAAADSVGVCMCGVCVRARA